MAPEDSTLEPSGTAPNAEDYPFAHSARGGQPWEPLFTRDCPTLAGDGHCAACHDLDPLHGHLNKVAFWCAKSAEEMFPPDSEAKEAIAAREWGRLAGLWHDLGKFSEEFQSLLRGEILRANHSTAGAQHAYRALPGIGQILAYLIAGHHAGLADLVGGDSSLRVRLTGEDFLAALPPEAAPLLKLPPPPAPPLRTKHPGAHALFTRMLFSCLVDADFLATEAFRDAERAARRPTWPDDVLERMADALDQRYDRFAPINPASREIDRRRAAVHADCLTAATRTPGLFTLTVPTGGGKTLASLAFALRHAREHGLRRVIYVVPYTSIIEQNADEYRDTFAALSDEIGREVVLEHHSNFEGDKDASDRDEKPLWQLAAENWDAPLVVTTAVQFFESLHAARTSRCRKLHRIARSVIVLDEAQTLPPDLLAPCLDSLRHLARHFGTTVVLCTATQPALGKLHGTPGTHAERWNKIALDLPADRSREIILDVPALFAHLARTAIADLGTLDDETLAARLHTHDRALCILNTKPHAARVFELLGDDPANFHLSAQLSPAHRADVLTEIRRREKAGEPSRVVATTVVEAGVDIDFPVVFRALTGLDSLAQAAGRCNRHGKLGQRGGQVFLFTPADQKTPAFLTHAVNATRSVLPDYRAAADTLILPDAIQAYFQHFYFGKGEWDKADIAACFQFANDSTEFPCAFNFKTAAQNFHLIPDAQLPVIIDPKPALWPGQDEAKSAQLRDLIDAIRNADRYKRFPPSGAHRRLQRHTVQIPKSIHAAMVAEGKIQPLCEGRFPVLVHPENDYDPKLGLLIPAHMAKPGAFII